MRFIQTVKYFLGYVSFLVIVSGPSAYARHSHTPTVSLSASPNSIISGASSTLTWSSLNASLCTASGAWSGTQSTSGTLKVTPIANSTYTLSCTGSGGSASQSVTMTVSAAPTPTPTPTPTPSPSPSPVPSSLPIRYLSQYPNVKCDGNSDDSIPVAQAVLGARNNSYALYVDCPANLNIGINVSRSIFIDDGTTVIFTGAGKFIVNNMFVPAFVFANSSSIDLENWNVVFNPNFNWRFAPGMPIDHSQHTYFERDVDSNGQVLGGDLPHGIFTTQYITNSYYDGAGEFNDVILTRWLSHRRNSTENVTFPYPYKSRSVGDVNHSAIFFFTGAPTKIAINKLSLHAMDTAHPNLYIPFVACFVENYKNGATAVQNYQTDPVTGKTTWDTYASGTTASTAFGIPNDIHFSVATIDGALMGFQGNLANSTFDQLTELHYSDLQDATGSNVGGVGTFFPPPHLFYFNYFYNGDSNLFNSAINITNVNDAVVPNAPAGTDYHTGNFRNSGGGYADSLKFGCTNSCLVDHYNSNRPDGFMDVLSSKNVTISNVTAYYNSYKANVESDPTSTLSWPAIRFPGGGSPAYYNNFKFSNITLTDLATATQKGPLGNNVITNNSLIFENVNFYVPNWINTNNIAPTITGWTGTGVQFHLIKQNTIVNLK